MATSPLLSLSAELRNPIYEFTLYQSEPINVRGGYKIQGRDYPNATFLRSSCSTAHPAAIIMICKSVHNESSSMPYFLNTFAFECNHLIGDDAWCATMTAAKLFLQQIGPKNRSVLRSIRFEFTKIRPVLSLPLGRFLDLAQLAREQPQITDFQCAATFAILHARETWNKKAKELEVNVNVRKLFESFGELAENFLARSKVLEQKGGNWTARFRLGMMEDEMRSLLYELGVEGEDPGSD
ncbi:hypothetical protein LTS10_012489 [Elasticomyces elasticus]|nr:hypothetical protein LTS10_012489 [Elasticomyces elasticus]